MLRISISILFIISMMASPINSKILMQPLSQMVEESEFIVIGKVVKIEKINNKRNEYGYKNKAMIEIEESIKGDKAIKNIVICYSPALSTEPEFLLNERCIFFINVWKGEYRVYQGYGGKVTIKNDKVRPLYIQNESKIQNLYDFVQKIKKLMK